jgi:hypothetical protein
MSKKRRYWSLAAVMGAILVISLVAPSLLYSPPDNSDLPLGTPRPTSTIFKMPVINVVDIVGVSTPEPDQEDPLNNCTYPAYYWRDRPESWPAETSIGGQLYTRPEMAEMFAEETPGIGVRLGLQVYTAFLNIIHGSDLTVIEPVIIESAEWLEENPPGTQLSEFNRQ